MAGTTSIAATLKRTPGYTVGSLGSWEMPAHQSCVEFVREHGVAPSGGRRGGLDFHHRSYQLGLFEAYDRAEVRSITAPWCSQAGKSTGMLNLLMYHTCTRPSAAMVVVPDKKSRNDFLEDRLRKAIQRSDRWRSELMTGKLDDDVIQTKVRLKNAPIYLALAGSEADLAQRDCELVAMDEVDKYPKSTRNEGGPEDQAKARDRTFRQGGEPKQLKFSTPTDKKGSIWGSYEESDKCRWHVACPHCGTEQPWELRNLKRDARPVDPLSKRKRPLREHAEGIKRGEVKVWYEFPCCNHRIDSKREKDRLNREGRWVAGAPDVRDHVGLRVTCFDIPDETFESIMIEYLGALDGLGRGDDRKMKVFHNHWLATFYEPKHKRRGVEMIQERIRSRRRGMVPADCEYVTLGIDVQGAENGVYWVALGFKAQGPTVYVIDWGHIAGEFERIQDKLNEVINREWQWEGLSIRREKARLVYEDSGDGENTVEVYRHCLGFDDARVRPIKGNLEGLDFWKASGPKVGAMQPHGGLLVRLNSTLLKDSFTELLRRKPEDPHVVTFPIEAREDLDLQEQMVSEERRWVAGPKGPKVSWVENGPNHYWDCVIYGFGAAVVLGILEEVDDGPPSREASAGDLRSEEGDEDGGRRKRSRRRDVVEGPEVSESWVKPRGGRGSWLRRG